MGGSSLPAATLARGAGMGLLTWQERYRHIVLACAQSAIITGIEPLVLEEPVLKLRAHVGALVYVEVFFNADTGKTSLALIKEGKRFFGADHTRGWHIHPFDNPDAHAPSAAVSFDGFRPPPLAAPPTLSEVVDYEMRALGRGQDVILRTADAFGCMIRPMR